MLLHAICSHTDTHATHTQDASGSFERLVEVMDAEGASGWSLLRELLKGEVSALQLSQHPFVNS